MALDYISRGTVAKFKCEITADGFSMDANSFGIYLLWGMRGQKLSIEKSAMIRNNDGEWFFSFDTTDMFGPIRAVCWYWPYDRETQSISRKESDAIVLCVVRAKDACSVDDGMVDDGCGCPAHYSNQSGGCGFGIWLCASEDDSQSEDVEGGADSGE